MDILRKSVPVVVLLAQDNSGMIRVLSVKFKKIFPVQSEDNSFFDCRKR